MERFPSRLIHYADHWMTLDSNRLLVALQQPIERSALTEIIEEYGLRYEPEGHPLREPINHTNRRVWVRSDAPIPDIYLSRLEARSEIDWVSPVYRRVDLNPRLGRSAYLSPLPQVLLIQFHAKTSPETIEQVEQNYQLTRIPFKTKYLSPFRYYQLPQTDAQGNRTYVYQLRDQIRLQETVWIQSIHFESMPLISPFCFEPNDPIYQNYGESGRWNLEIIDAPAGWDISTGDESVVIAVIDRGCDLNHPDLAFDGPGFNAETGENDGSPVGTANPEHGTHSAGIAAARINNNLGVAGIAGNCRIHAVAITNGTDAEFLAALNESASTPQVRAINISMATSTWDTEMIDAAIVNAHDGQDIVLCASAGNADSEGVAFPARHPLIMAVGASDQDDRRISVSNWGSSWGADLDVMAPSSECWTTDLLGEPGSTDGDYYSNYSGTSCAAPHVTGLAALIRSRYPTLSNVEVRTIIERTCEKVSQAEYSYAYNPDKPNGFWHEEMGYGRINVFRALDFAEVYIKDNPADNGWVPFNGNFYAASDIVVRQSDDGVFSYQPAVQGQTNYIYVRVTNAGPAIARQVSVSVRAVPFAGTEFLYIPDWIVTDATHIQPTAIANTFATLNPGATAIARFSLSAAQVDQLYGWQVERWHPCLLAAVECDNDYGSPVGYRTWLNNNLAQRNISVIAARVGAIVVYPFVAGHRLNEDDYLELVIDRHRLPRDVELLLDPGLTNLDVPAPSCSEGQTIQFLDQTRIIVSHCGCDGVLTLAAGSRFECGTSATESLHLWGAKWVTHQGKRSIAIQSDRAIIGVRKRPGEVRRMALSLRVPNDAELGQRYQVDVSQRNTEQETVGGAVLQVEVAD